MRAAPDVKRATLPLDYYSRLQSARTFLEGEVEAELASPRPNTQNKRLLETISYLQGLNELTDEEQDYLKLLHQAVSQSALAKKALNVLRTSASVPILAQWRFSMPCEKPSRPKT